MKLQVSEVKLDPERVYQAIREGVAEGVWVLASSATSMPCRDFYGAIEDGIKAAMLDLNQPEKEP